MQNETETMQGTAPATAAPRKITFTKYGVKYDGKYIPVYYWDTRGEKHPAGTIQIHCKSCADDLPAELNPINNTDIQTDYFEDDRAFIYPSSPFYPDVLAAALKRDPSMAFKHAVARIGAVLQAAA